MTFEKLPICDARRRSSHSRRRDYRSPPCSRTRSGRSTEVFSTQSRSRKDNYNICPTGKSHTPNLNCPYVTASSAYHPLQPIPIVQIRSTGSLTRDTALRDRPETLDVVLFKQYLAHKKLDLELDAVVPRLQAVCRTYLTCKASQFQGRKRHQLAQWRQHLIAQPTFLVSLQASIRGGSVRSASGAKRHQLGDWHRRLVDRPESLISLQAALRTALMCQSKGRKQHQLAQWHRYLKAQPAFLITLQSSIRGWTVRSACGGKRHQLGDWRRRLIDRPESLTSFQAALRTALMCQSKGKKQYQLAQWHRYLTTQPAFLISLQSSIRGWTVRSAYGGKRHQLGDWRRRLVDRPESLTSLQAALRTALMCQSKGRKQHQLAQWRQYLVAQSALIPLQTAIRGWLARSASGEKRHHMGDWRRCLVDRPNLLICLQAVLRTALTQDRFQRLRHTFVPLHLFHFSAVVQDTLMRNQIGQVTSLFLLLFPYEVRYVRIRAEANLWCFSIAFWSLNSYIQTLVAHTWSGICVWGLCHPTVAPLVGISRKPYFAATPSLRICGGFALILTLFWLILSSQTTVSDVPMMATDSTRFRRVVEIGLANSNR